MNPLVTPPGMVVPKEKKWLRHVSQSGDRGFMVQVDGVDHVHYDRADGPVVKFTKEWVDEDRHRPLTHAQVVQCAFEADRKLCQALGLRRLADRDWGQLTDEQRSGWMTKGPSEPPIRAVGYKAFVEAIEAEQKRNE